MLLTAEEDKGRFESEMGEALRACARSFVVVAQSAPAPEPKAAEKEKAAKKRGRN